jgi:hypothetical protein
MKIKNQKYGKGAELRDGFMSGVRCEVSGIRYQVSGKAMILKT